MFEHDLLKVTLTHVKLIHSKLDADKEKLCLVTRAFQLASLEVEHCWNENLKLTLNNFEIMMVIKYFIALYTLVTSIVKENLLSLDVSILCTLNENFHHMINNPKSPLCLQLLQFSQLSAHFLEGLE